MLARAGHELLWPALETNLIKSSAVNSVCLGALLLLPVLTTVGFLLMCTQRSQEELERTARLDHLTGIYNRRAIEDLASRALSAARRHGIPLAILILDLDHFQRIHDQFGHEAGDRALIETVRRMREIMRAEDLVGRQGGEEFVALMPDIDLRSAHAAAERLRRAFAERPMSVPDGDGSPVELTVTVSVGVAALQADDLLFSHLLRRADRAMYAAKAAGRNRVMLDAGPG
jgi:diguanylate cyclase (GGDEF)-like protein